MHPFQKPLGWVQRFFYQVEHGELPAPNIVLSINHDWPLVPTTLDRSYATAAGTVTTELYAPAPGKHGLVVFASTQNPGGIWPANDFVALLWDRNPSAPPGFRIIAHAPVGYDTIPLIQGVSANNGGPTVRGNPPVYVPAGFRLVLTHLSVAGGVNAVCRVQVYERDAFLPLRLP